MAIELQIIETFVGQLAGFRPPDDDPGPIGPWGPIIRVMLSHRLRAPVQLGTPILAFGPQPEPWRLIALNPQPLPPLPTDPVPWLARQMTEALLARAELLADVGRATGNDSLAADFVRDMVEDLCPPPRRFPIPPFPKGDGDPPPRPDELVVDAATLVMIGAGLRDAAGWTAHDGLRVALRDAGLRGIEAGVESFAPAEVFA